MALSLFPVVMMACGKIMQVKIIVERKTGCLINILRKEVKKICVIFTLCRFCMAVALITLFLSFIPNCWMPDNQVGVFT